MTYWLGFNDIARVVAGQQLAGDLPPCFPSVGCWNLERRMGPDMKQSEFSAEQTSDILRERDAAASVLEVCCKHGMSAATFNTWEANSGEMDVSEAKQLSALEEENARLKRLYADAMLDNAGLKDLLARTYSPAPSASRL